MFGQPQVPSITPAEVNGMAGAVLVDIREDDEWQAGHAPDAVHLPLSRLRADDLPEDSTLLCICRSGARSARATEALRNAGFDAVNVAGGMRAWSSAGLPIVRDDGGAGTVV
ncbi:MAG TPA: rhodanese-like domain-containing protein [Acidimicrobiales bacterium]|nr:rhodanese-like domain-containing protein [Acidimicrobiales bacterium]